MRYAASPVHKRDSFVFSLVYIYFYDVYDFSFYAIKDITKQQTKICINKCMYLK